jgi:predicted GNAT family acetyltransferase
VLAIDELFVARPHRRKGVAPDECVRICLEVDRRNRTALAPYKRLGFEPSNRSVLTRAVKRS